MERYRQRVWRLAYRVLRDREEAWDCAQEAFVRAFQSLGSFRGQSAFYTWLFRITVNLATDRQRARGAQARAFGAEQVPDEEWTRTTRDPGAGPEHAAARAEQRERIRRALDSLPPKARTIIMLSDVEGLSYREIAEVLNCPIGTVMSRLHNARKRLKTLLGPMLALLLWLAVCLGAALPVRAEPVIRFGVRVLLASNPVDPQAPPESPSATRRSAVETPPFAPAPKPLPPPSLAAPTGAAAKEDAEIEERIKRILPRLRGLFRYSDYTTLERHAVEGPLGVRQRMRIQGGRWLEVTPDEMPDKLVRMRVRLLKGDRAEMNTTILAAPGAPAIVGGPSSGNGVLIIILWASSPPKTADR